MKRCVLRAPSRPLHSYFYTPHHQVLVRARHSGRMRPQVIGLQRNLQSFAQVRESGVHYRTTPFAARAQASFSSYIVLIALVATAAIAADYATTNSTATIQTQTSPDQESQTSQDPPPPTSKPSPKDLPDFDAMSIEEGHLGNLTPEQEQKLKEFWRILLKAFGVQDPNEPEATRPETPANGIIQQDPDSAKQEKRGWFRRHKASVSSVSSPTSSTFGGSDPEDKYGQTKELQEILATATPAELRAAFWSMIKNDHPDQLLLRFLRARKWDVQRALAMLISTIHWRKNTMKVDDDIMKMGEGFVLEQANSGDPDANDFMQQLRMGKSYLHGIDKQGRPMSVVRVRLHRGGDQTVKSIERFTVYLIETARLTLKPPVETATIIFDMTGFTLANMDYTPVKFMIKVFEANYPESLGCVLIHNAPWIFQGIWKIIKGWLDPVVAAKIHFTSGVQGLEEYIPRSQIMKELGGDENWEYKYIEPVADENVVMKQEQLRTETLELRHKEERDFESKTFDYLHGKDVNADRAAIAQQLRSHYWRMDPFIRARSLYDRTGMIMKDGSVDYYPTQTVKTDNLPTTNGVTMTPPAAAAGEVAA